MSNQLQISQPAFGLFFILALWVFFYWIYRDYRVDVFRQKLFRLRDELFMLAANGDLDFEHTAYGMTRMTLNGFLRFADRFNIISAILMARKMRDAQESVTRFELILEQSMNQLDDETKDAVTSIISRMHLVIAEQLILTSLLFWVFIVPVVTILLGAWLTERMKSKIQHVKLWRTFRYRWVSALDDAALTTGKI